MDAKHRGEKSPRAPLPIDRLDDESLRAVSGGSGKSSNAGKKLKYLEVTMTEAFVTHVAW